MSRSRSGSASAASQSALSRFARFVLPGKVVDNVQNKREFKKTLKAFEGLRTATEWEEMRKELEVPIDGTPGLLERAVISSDKKRSNPSPSETQALAFDLILRLILCGGSDFSQSSPSPREALASEENYNAWLSDLAAKMSAIFESDVLDVLLNSISLDSEKKEDGQGFVGDLKGALKRESEKPSPSTKSHRHTTSSQPLLLHHLPLFRLVHILQSHQSLSASSKHLLLSALAHTVSPTPPPTSATSTDSRSSASTSTPAANAGASLRAALLSQRGAMGECVQLCTWAFVEYEEAIPESTTLLSSLWPLTESLLLSLKSSLKSMEEEGKIDWFLHPLFRSAEKGRVRGPTMRSWMAGAGGAGGVWLFEVVEAGVVTGSLVRYCIEPQSTHLADPLSLLKWINTWDFSGSIHLSLLAFYKTLPLSSPPLPHTPPPISPNVNGKRHSRGKSLPKLPQAEPLPLKVAYLATLTNALKMPGVGKSVASKLLSSFKIKVIVAGVATEESGIALEEFVKDVIYYSLNPRLGVISSAPTSGTRHSTSERPRSLQPPPTSSNSSHTPQPTQMTPRLLLLGMIYASTAEEGKQRFRTIVFKTLRNATPPSTPSWDSESPLPSSSTTPAMARTSISGPPSSHAPSSAHAHSESHSATLLNDLVNLTELFYPDSVGVVRCVKGGQPDLEEYRDWERFFGEGMFWEIELREDEQGSESKEVEDGLKETESTDKDEKDWVWLTVYDIVRRPAPPLSASASVSTVHIPSTPSPGSTPLPPIPPSASTPALAQPSRSSLSIIGMGKRRNAISNVLKGDKGKDKDKDKEEDKEWGPSTVVTGEEFGWPW